MRRFLFIFIIPSLLIGSVPWSLEEIVNNLQTLPYHPLPLFDSSYQSRHNYLYEIRQTCDFVARYQVADSLSQNFGGIIEAEHLPNIIETDNTQEAIWIWTRWYELTGRDDYRLNIRRAWQYVMRYPAYREGTGQYVWYSVWNCGLAFFTEMEYRKVYGDSTYLAYTDTCREYLFAHPLNFTTNPLHSYVTAFAAGMMYRYAQERQDWVLKDSALAYGNRVRTFIEQQPSRLRTGNWAMSGGTIVWGLSNSIFRADTILGKNWLQIYADSVPYFMPTGQWNCSWNIWNANGFRATNEINHEPRFLEYHKRLTDTLLGRDEDDDGGIPATWTDPQTQDQTWVSTYLVFMGMDWFVTPTYDYDAGLLSISGIEPKRIYLPGDTVQPKVIVTNFGRQSLFNVPVGFQFPNGSDTNFVNLDFLEIDTIEFDPVVFQEPGLFFLKGFTNLLGDENRSNDTAWTTIKVWTKREISGEIRDSVSNQPIAARIESYLFGDSLVFDTANTDTFGRFRLTGIDTTFLVKVYPVIPYPNRQWLVRIYRDTLLQFAIRVANLLLINNDPQSQYETYYTSTFDTLNLSYCIWRRRTAGPVPISVMNRLSDGLMVWYTGDAVTQTLDSTDMDSITRFLSTGGKLFLTGQNIGEELAQTQFYQNVIHARLRNPTVNNFWAFGSRSDSLGSLFGQTQTAGYQGANNQTSRDEIAPDSFSNAFLLYDTISGQIAGIYYHNPINLSKIIYLGFGFEALNRPTNRPTFMSRVTFFNQCYNWLTGQIGITEFPISTRPTPSLTITPNPSTKITNIIYSLPKSGNISLKMYDITGRLIRKLVVGYRNTGLYTATLNNSTLTKNIYFLILETESYRLTQKLIIQ